MAHEKRNRGMYPKYYVSRIDGSDQPGGIHHGSDYYVLDLTNDKFAKPAIVAYVDACKTELPALAIDLMSKVNDVVPNGQVISDVPVIAQGYIQGLSNAKKYLAEISAEQWKKFNTGSAEPDLIAACAAAKIIDAAILAIDEMITDEQLRPHQ